jgi:hypothetical protein
MLWLVNYMEISEFSREMMTCVCGKKERSSEKGLSTGKARARFLPFFLIMESYFEQRLRKTHNKQTSTARQCLQVIPYRNSLYRLYCNKYKVILLYIYLHLLTGLLVP